MTDEKTEETSAAKGRLEGLKATALSPLTAGGLILATFVPGVGIANQAYITAPSSGNLTWLTYVVGTLVLLCIAVAVIVFARRYVASGALYAYISRVFGWGPSLVAAASILFAYILGILFFVVSGARYLGAFIESFAGNGWAVSPVGYSTIAIVMVIVGGIITYFGIDISARVTIALLIISLPVTLFVTLLIPFHADIDVASQFDVANADVPLSGFIGGITICLAVSILFESSTATAAETRNSRRVMPWIVAGVPIILGVLYVFSTLIQVPALGYISDDLEAGVPAIAAFATLGGVGWLGTWINLVLGLAMAGGVISFLNYSSRIAATMAQDGVLPRGLSRVDPRRGTPTLASVVIAAIVVVFTIVTLVVNAGDTYATYIFTASLYTLFVVIPYVLICAAAVVLLARERSKHLWFVIITSTIGAAAFIYLFVQGFVFTGEGAIGAIPYIFIGIMALTVVALFVYHARVGTRRRMAEEQTPAS